MVYEINSLSRNMTISSRLLRQTPFLHQPRATPQPKFLSLAIRYSIKAVFYTGAFYLLFEPSAPDSIRGITGESMYPTLASDPKSKDWIQFLRMPRKALTTIDSSNPQDAKRKGLTAIRRGQLVLFNSPGEPDKLAVKRVIGLPCDTITPIKKQFRDGKLRTQPAQPTTVPTGHLWVEGDNPAQSFDSADYGPVSQSLIQGVAYSRAGWPWRWTWAGRKWKKVNWENDGWEERLGVSKDGRLKRREDSIGWEGEVIPEALKLHHIGNPK